MADGGYMKILAGYVSSVFQDFESFDRKKSMIVSDNTIEAEGLGSFSKIWERFLQKQVKN